MYTTIATTIVSFWLTVYIVGDSYYISWMRTVLKLHYVSEKNDTDLACYNSDVHQLILIILAEP